MSRYGHLSTEQYVGRIDGILETAVLRGGRPRGLCVCTHGHPGCALETRGRCGRDERSQLVDLSCDACKGTGNTDPRDPFSENCRDCSGTGRSS